MKTYKKLFALSLATIMAFAMSVSAYAKEEPMAEATVEVVSEFSLLQELKVADVSELLSDGYDLADIEAIKSGTLEQFIMSELMSRATMSDDILLNKGYSLEEISKLRTLSGNESIESIQGLLASVTVTNKKNAYYYKTSADRTYFLIDVSWSWDKEPVVNFTDIVAAGWAGNYQLTNSISKSNNRLTLHCIGNGPQAIAKKLYVNITSSDINAGKATFAMNQGDYDDDAFYWVKSGSGTIELSYVGPDNNAEFIFKYGHATLSLSPSLSTGGLALAFNTGIDTFTPSSGAVYGGRADIK